MAIYNIFDYSEKNASNLHSQEAKRTIEKVNLAEAKVGFHEEERPWRDRFFSSLGARLFFLLLLVADIFWGVYVIAAFSALLVLCTLTFFKVKFLRRLFAKFCLSFKRFLVAALSLLIALVSPALGIMFACTYFLMYDKEGIEEIVPASLREQFKEFFSA